MAFGIATDPLNRAFAPTIPADTLDPPEWGKVLDTVKDNFILQLRKFFTNAQISGLMRTEIPIIEKYADFGGSGDQFPTAPQIISRLPDLTEALPHVAVMAASSGERRLTIGTPYGATVQQPAFIIAANAEPYALSAGQVLSVRTLPNGRTPTIENIVFTSDRFPTANPITNALAADVARVINEQSQYFSAQVYTSSNVNYVQLSCGGKTSFGNSGTPTELEVTPQSVGADAVFGLGRGGTPLSIGGTAPNLTLTASAGTWSSADISRYVYITDTHNPYFNNGRFLITNYSTLGGTDTLTFTSPYGKTEGSGSGVTWYIGHRDDFLNPSHPPKNRYLMSSDVSVQLDIYADDPNTRTELVDLVNSFFGFYLEQQYFTFMGRSFFPGQSAQGEYYQIVLQPPLHVSSETEFPRPGDGTGKVHAQSFTIQCTCTWALDRNVLYPGTTTPWIITANNIVFDPTLPLPSAGGTIQPGS